MCYDISFTAKVNELDIMWKAKKVDNPMKSTKK